jgi:hypothetical protein
MDSTKDNIVKILETQYGQFKDNYLYINDTEDNVRRVINDELVKLNQKIVKIDLYIYLVEDDDKHVMIKK